MAKITGESGYVKEGSTSVAEMMDWTLTTDRDMYDGTIFGDTWHENVAGLGSATAVADGFWYIGDTGQAALQTAYLNGTTITLNLSPNGTNAYSATAFVKGLVVKAPVNGIVAFTANFQITGAVTYA